MRTPSRSIRAITEASGKSIFSYKSGQAERFHFGAQNRRQALQKIGSFAGRAGKRDVQMPQNYFGKFVLGGGGPQQVGIEHRGMAHAGQRFA